MRKIKIPEIDIINCLANNQFKIKDRIITFYEVNNISMNIQDVFKLIQKFESKYSFIINDLYNTRNNYSDELKCFDEKNKFFNDKMKKCICENYKVKAYKVAKVISLEDDIENALTAIINKKIECYKMNNLLYKYFMQGIYN